MEKGIIRTIRYFLQFDYAPDEREIHRFLPQKATYSNTEKVLRRMAAEAKIVQIRKKTRNLASKYTLPEYTISLNGLEKKERFSARKEAKTMNFIRFLSSFPQIKLIGFSGSVAMGNAGEDADVDLFIITEAGRMWTARFLANAAAGVAGVRRGRTMKHIKDKICLNMFMDESDLTVPNHKQNSFVAHEILQMRPVFDRGAMYDRFLEENSWIYGFFPNAKDATEFPSLRAVAKQSHPRSLRRSAPRDDVKATGRSLGVVIEDASKKLQLFFINRHRTTEIVTDTQLWFFPDDYEKKVKE